MNPKRYLVEKNSYLLNYPILRREGIIVPDKKGRMVVNEEMMMGLFTEQPDIHAFTQTTFWMISDRLEEALDDAKVTADERSMIINRHVDFVKAALLRHKKALGDDYAINSETTEQIRGEFLREADAQPDATPVNATEYAYWLSSYADRFVDSNPGKFTHLKDDAEKMFRKAHEAGLIEATEALATFLYSERNDYDQAIQLWNKAAQTGNAIAIKNLATVIEADDSLTKPERDESLTCLWQGIAFNKKETLDTAKALRKAGMTMPVQDAEQRAPA